MNDIFSLPPGRIDWVVGRAAHKKVEEPSLIWSVQRTDYHSVNPEFDESG